MTRILLTGGTGFVGGHVAERLRAENHEVRALTRGRDDGGVLRGAGVAQVPGSLEDARSLAAAVEGVDVVVHAAGLVRGRSPAAFHAVNAGGTLALLRACAAARPRPRRFVLVSSLAAQGPSPDSLPAPPAEGPLRPVSHYGRSKARAERIARAHGDRMDIVIVRPPAVYGPRDRETLPFFRLAAAGWRPRLAGRDLRLSLIHAEDLARGVVAAATEEGATGGTFHLAHREILTLGGVLDAMGDAQGVPGRPVRLPRAALRLAASLGDLLAAALPLSPPLTVDKAREMAARAWICDPASACVRLRWEARIPAAAGVASTAAWYRDHGWLPGTPTPPPTAARTLAR